MTWCPMAGKVIIGSLLPSLWLISLDSWLPRDQGQLQALSYKYQTIFIFSDCLTSLVITQSLSQSPESDYTIGTLHYKWPMSVHVQCIDFWLRVQVF